MCVFLNERLCFWVVTSILVAHRFVSLQNIQPFDLRQHDLYIIDLKEQMLGLKHGFIYLYLKAVQIRSNNTKPQSGATAWMTACSYTLCNALGSE